MSKGRRSSAPKQPRSKGDLSELGIFGVPGMDGVDDDDDDPELEAELMSILSSGGGPSRRTPAPKKAKDDPSKVNLDKMIAESLRDIPSDESSGDEDDPSLLAELQEFTGGESQVSAAPTLTATSQPSADVISLLTERQDMYKEAEANAKAAGDTAKARRLGRGLKTLEDLLKKTLNGGAVDESEIPLPVAVKKAEAQPGPPVPARSAPSLPDSGQPLGEGGAEQGPPVPPRRSRPDPPALVEPANVEEVSVDSGVLKALQDRRDEYKRAAVAAKKSGDLETAKAHVRVIKQFENVIAGVEAGQKVDLKTMPPPPSQDAPESAPHPPPQSPPVASVPQPSISAPQPSPSAQPPVSQPEQGSEIPQPATVLEALQQRLAVFKKQEESAKNDGNASKARRMGRICKQYEDAIRLHNAGKEIPVDELPTPPGFPPIPVEKKEGAAPPPSPKPAGQHLSPGGPQAGQARAPSPSPPSPKAAAPPSPRPAAPPSPTPSTSSTASSNVPGRTTRQEKQLALLLKRQKEWKEAAIEAKKAGDIAKAKECLRQAKGFDALIDASRSGLPVDMSTIPVPPKDKVENDFEVVNITDCLPGSNSEIYEQLKSDLKNQFKMCMETRLHYKTLGDVANANKFEQLAVHTKKDLDRVMVLQERNDPVPRYHYEMRTFSIVRSNTDLNDNDLELNVIQGINYNVPNPKEIDTYVRYEFPFPQEEPKKEKFPTVYNTNNPQYNNTVIIPIVRSSRACQRVFKRQAVKLEVWSKGGFLRSDTLLGTVNVKLQPLETKCNLHDSFNLMDGRKPIGGKLEIKIRLRHPIQENEVEQVKEKWLLID